MLNFFRAMLALSFIFFSNSYATQTLTLDPEHTYVLWEINHLGFSTQAGKWYASGTLNIDQAQPQNSVVKAKINVNKMITGIPELDKHLRGVLFFDTAHYPEATFVSTKVIRMGQDMAEVTGNLTLHGVTKPIVLKVKLNKVGKNPVTENETAGFSATTTLKRSDFGINGFLPMVGDEVTLQINAEAYQAKKEANHAS